MMSFTSVKTTQSPYLPCCVDFGFSFFTGTFVDFLELDATTLFLNKFSYQNKTAYHKLSFLEIIVNYIKGCTLEPFLNNFTEKQA